MSRSAVIADVTFAVVTSAAGALAWIGSVRGPRGLRTVPLLIAGGLTASAVGDLIYLVYQRAGVPPDVSVADVAWSASYVFLAAALFLMLGRTASRNHFDVDAVIDVLTVVTVSVVIFWVLAVDAILSDPGESLFVRSVWAAYPVMDAVLLALVLRALVSPRSRSRMGMAFAVGVICWLGADIGFMLTPTSRGVVLLLDVGWMLGALLMAASTWRRPTEVTTAPSSDTVPGIKTGRVFPKVFIAIVPLMVPLAMESINDSIGRAVSRFEYLTGMVLLLALAFVRTFRLVRSERDANEQVRRSRRYHALVAANSSDATLVVDRHGRVKNPVSQLERLVGVESATRGSDWIELLRPVDPAGVRDAFTQVRGEPGTVFVVEVEVTHAAGGRAWLSTRMVNLLDDPDIEGVIVALADISDGKQVESALTAARDAALDASQMKSTFMATMSHEIRTPMNGVIGLSGLLLGTELDERQQQYALGVHSAAEALLAIINDILDFSKVEAGKLELETIDFDLVQVVEEAAELVAETAQGKGLELLAYCAPDLPIGVRGDPSRLRQVLLNLASNAVKFTAAGEVVIRAHLEDQSSERITVRFEVVDTGVGIDDADRERLFEAFAQADSSTTRKFGGTGLGLAISQKLVSAMGGELGVESRPGQGSTFWFTLPLGVAQHPFAATPACPPACLAGLRSLIVDDNHTNRLVLCQQLLAWGMLPEAVKDGHQALIALQEAAADGRPYALAVLDLCMPEMDGIELGRRISRDPELDATALVLLTSGPDVSATEAAEAGLAARLTKPVRLSQLNTALGLAISTDGALSRRLTPHQAHAALPAVTGQGHVLVVEDNAINQLVAVAILEHLGYTSEVAGNGLEALTAMKHRSFAAVLMDCQMPEMDGYAATAAIRSIEGPHRHTPVIAMTAGAIDGDRERCLAAGMDDYVSKPVTPGEVQRTLGRWLDITAGCADAAVRPGRPPLGR